MKIKINPKEKTTIYSGYGTAIDVDKSTPALDLWGFLFHTLKDDRERVRSLTDLVKRLRIIIVILLSLQLISMLVGIIVLIKCLIG